MGKKNNNIATEIRWSSFRYLSFVVVCLSVVAKSCNQGHFHPLIFQTPPFSFSSAVISTKLRSPLNYTGPSRQSSLLFPR